MIVAPRLVVFDIPHIVDSICDHLDSKDIWRCYRVSRSWRYLFGPHRYKNVRFADLDASQTWHILDNAHRIRNLTVDLADAEYLLRTTTRCTRLRELSCVDMGYMTWPAKEEEDEWFWEYTPTWINLEPSANALSLIHRNPGLEQLKINHIVYGASVDPFTKQVLNALLHHPALKRISINLQMYLHAVMALLTHLPSTLQELELDLDIYCDHVLAAQQQQQQITTTTSTTNTMTTTTTLPLQLPHTTRLRRLVYRESLVDYEHIILIPLLKQCPLLEELDFGFVSEGAFSEIVTTLTGYCPRLQSFTHEFRNSDLLRTVNILLEASLHGLRALHLTSAWFYTVDNSSVEADTGALVKALLKYSAHTIEVISLSGQMRHWIKGMNAVLEQCPNLKELHVLGDYIHLDDIVQQTRWETRSLWGPPASGASSSAAAAAAGTTTTTTTTPESSNGLLLPWACKKLESLSLFLYKPQSTAIDFSVQPHERDQETNDMIEELALTTVLQVGVLWKTLKSLKSLKTLSLNWDQPVYQTIGTMPFDRGVYYMDQIGLSGITQAELEWMGVQWEAIIDRLRSEEAAKLSQAALDDRTGCDAGFVEDACRCYHGSSRHYWAEPEDTDVDWPFDVNQKKFHKSGQLYSRRSVRSGANWFSSRARR
ncbi:hypothetical protein BGX34_012070 [Mortierella sp. NVP85]|nr:hypothetical protein BGX34_012070 [Mortierella sp. NVP85]